MTGATRGIGHFAAIDMLRDTPDLHLVVVARSRAIQPVLDDLFTASGNANVSAVTADLASLASIRTAAATLRARLDAGTLPPLHGFVGNAGLQFMDAKQVSVDGFEQTFAVNVLANHVFIHELEGHFVAPARIVLTTSDTHFGDFAHNMGMVPAPSWRPVDQLARPGTADHADSATAGRTAYSTSKLAVIYQVHALARRLPEGVSAYAFNPGLVPGTGLQRDAGPFARFVFGAIMPLMTITPFATRPETAGANLAAAVSGTSPGESGAYISGRKAEASSTESYDPRREDELWRAADRLGGITPRDG